MSEGALRLTDASPRLLAGVGGIGAGLFFALDGEHTLGRNENRPARLLDVRDYRKLHIIAHYVAVLLGAGNEAGFRVVPVGKVGDDAAGKQLLREMAAAGVETEHVVTQPDKPTMLSVCFQYPDGAGGNITTSDSAAAALTVADVERIEPLLAEHAGRSIVLAAPEAPLEPRRKLLELGGKYGALCAAAFTSAEIPAARRLGMFDMLDLLALNQDAAAALLGRDFGKAETVPFLLDIAAVLTRFRRAASVIITAGSQAAYAIADWNWAYRQPPEVPVASTAGADDALLAGVLACLAAGVPLVVAGEKQKPGKPERPLASALDFGVLLAAYTVTSPHTIHPDARLERLLEFAAANGQTFAEPLSKALPA